MYEAMEHPAVNSYTAAVDCDDSKIVDNVFDEMLCNVSDIICPIAIAYSMGQIIQDAQLSQRDRAVLMC